jgi:hypothetical protein
LPKCPKRLPPKALQRNIPVLALRTRH